MPTHRASLLTLSSELVSVWEASSCLDCIAWSHMLSSGGSGQRHLTRLTHSPYPPTCRLTYLTCLHTCSFPYLLTADIR